MPEISGLEVLRRIRGHDPELPVIILSSEPTDEVRAALRLGPTDYVEKPIDPVLFRHRVRLLLESAARRQTGPASPSLSRSIRVTLPELHDPKGTGRLDASRIAGYLGVPLAQLAEALGANYTAVHKTPAAPAVQEGLRPIKRSLEILADMFADPKEVRTWLNSPHPDLGIRTPLQVILEGHADALRTLLENAVAGIPT